MFHPLEYSKHDFYNLHIYLIDYMINNTLSSSYTHKLVGDRIIA